MHRKWWISILKSFITDALAEKKCKNEKENGEGKIGKILSCGEEKGGKYVEKENMFRRRRRREKNKNKLFYKYPRE